MEYSTKSGRERSYVDRISKSIGAGLAAVVLSTSLSGCQTIRAVKEDIGSYVERVKNTAQNYVSGEKKDASTSIAKTYPVPNEKENCGSFFGIEYCRPTANNASEAGGEGGAGSGSDGGSDGGAGSDGGSGGAGPGSGGGPSGGGGTGGSAGI